jgi:hypothetical protein
MAILKRSEDMYIKKHIFIHTEKELNTLDPSLNTPLVCVNTISIIFEKHIVFPGLST